MARSRFERRWLIGGMLTVALVLAIGGMALLHIPSRRHSVAPTETAAVLPAYVQLSDPCALFSTKGQLVIGGHHLAASMPATVAGARVCVWFDKKRIVEVSIATADTQLDEALREAALHKKSAPVRVGFSIPASPATTVHGIGDTARQERDQDGAVKVEIRRGQCFVSLDNVSRDKKEPDEASAGPQTRALASRLVRKLDTLHACV